MAAVHDHPGWRALVDPGFLVDGDWLCEQMARRDPLWDDWHRNAQPMPTAAVATFEQLAQHGP
ncbi:MAG: hypothetical protein ACRDKX_04810 [Solirubrobacterales bacterium]